VLKGQTEGEELLVEEDVAEDVEDVAEAAVKPSQASKRFVHLFFEVN
jgi:hypothetical protein